MHAIGSHYLAINAGSSSIKFALYDSDPAHAPRFDGSIAGIGGAQGCFTVQGPPAASFVRRFTIPEHVTAVNVLLDWLTEHLAPDSLGAIAYRVVHGRATSVRTQEISEAMLVELYGAMRREPGHLPQEVHLIDTLRRRYPAARHIACFDSGFHATMPACAHTLAIPHRYTSTGLRRFGYHGLSCTWMMRELHRLAGATAADGKVVLAHLGGGSSVTAVHHGQSQDTSMGLTPAGGLPMGTRSGDIDPGLLLHFTGQEAMSPARLHHMLHHESGLLGVSGRSGDMQVLLEHEVADPRCGEAVDLFVYQTRKAICAMAGAIDGIDTLVFTGGIGEHCTAVRWRICDGLRHLGVILDLDRNTAHAAIVSDDASRVQVRVMGTDEQWVLADQARQLLDGQAPAAQSGSAA